MGDTTHHIPKTGGCLEAVGKESDSADVAFLHGFVTDADMLKSTVAAIARFPYMDSK
jgi:hypothetical protein